LFFLFLNHTKFHGDRNSIMVVVGVRDID